MKYLFVLLLILTGMIANAQQKIVPLYEGVAPGSEDWNWEEQVNDSNPSDKVIYNVVQPTLTVFPARGMINTGTAVIIAPGGGFFLLAINKEGNDVAEWLSKKGITAFVLKHRLVHTSDPFKEAIAAIPNRKLFDSIAGQTVCLAMNDGLAAVAYVRKHAADYNINPNRIGFMGFSAGGGLTMSVAYNAREDNRPNFIAPIYPYTPGIIGMNVPEEKMPAFIVVASDDQLDLVPASLEIYNKWLTARQPVELHIYETGGHGFGMSKQDLPSDDWIVRYEDWLGANGLLWPEKPNGRLANLTYIGLKKYLANQEEMQRRDWANLGKYSAENKYLMAKPKDERLVVFMGNSITEFWKTIDSSYFAGKPYIDRGISGQTTPQMLLRFREDVIDLKPKVVVILAGINDITENTGPIPLESVFGNIVSMAELAKANNIKVILSSVLPANDFPGRPELKVKEKVMKLNVLIKDYGSKNKLIYVDYFPALADETGGMKSELSPDGIHPNLAGYRIMEPLVDAAIQKALK